MNLGVHFQTYSGQRTWKYSQTQTGKLVWRQGSNSSLRKWTSLSNARATVQFFLAAARAVLYLKSHPTCVLNNCFPWNSQSSWNFRWTKFKLWKPKISGRVIELHPFLGFQSPKVWVLARNAVMNCKNQFQSGPQTNWNRSWFPPTTMFDAKNFHYHGGFRTLKNILKKSSKDLKSANLNLFFSYFQLRLEIRSAETFASCLSCLSKCKAPCQQESFSQAPIAVL